MKNRSLRLTVIFSVAVFLVVTITAGLIGVCTILLYRLGVLQQSRNPDVVFILLAIASIIVGTISGRIGTDKMIAPIVEISEATKEVAKGNFDIHLKKISHATEVGVMARNFMLMAQELKNTETFHNDFIHNVSHEFKTPLSAIEGYATLLQNKSLSEDKHEAYVAKILHNSKRLSTLTGNILLLSRLENQQITTEKQRFSLDEQLREEIVMLQEEWNNKNIEMDVELSPVEYFGNSDLLSQVWQNLIGNAVKYVGDNGRIRILLGLDNGFATVRIADNGVGMSEEVKKRAFDKFYQGDISHAGKGNGLGLTLAKRIVDLHGGTISVSSKEGKGSTFTVSLPVSE